MRFRANLGIDTRSKAGKNNYNCPLGNRSRLLVKFKALSKFAQERRTYRLFFIVLKHATHALVLDSNFLQASDTLKKHWKRLETVYTDVQ